MCFNTLAVGTVVVGSMLCTLLLGKYVQVVIGLYLLKSTRDTHEPRRQGRISVLVLRLWVAGSDN